MTPVIVLVAAAAFFLGIVAGYAIGYFRGYRRARELAACEPPTRGRLHFLDGPIVTYHSCGSVSSRH